MPLIVLTGVNGFIGTNLCEKTLSASPEELGFAEKPKIRFSNFDEQKNDSIVRVIGSDMSSSLSRDIAKRFLGSARYTYCDYESLLQTLESLPTPPDVIVHNGACTSNTETNPDVFKKLNLEYSQKLWLYCTKYNVPFIYASSAVVYGNGEHGFSDKKEDCENYVPLSLYAQSKLDFDLWVLEQEQSPPVWFGLRYFNVFGPHEGHKEHQASMIYQGYFQAVQTGKIKLFKSSTDKYKDGEQLRDFVSVDDVVRVIKLLMKIAILKKNKTIDIVSDNNGYFLNVGSGVETTWNTLAKTVFEAINLPINIEYIPTPENMMHAFQNETCADLSSLQSLFLSLKEHLKTDSYYHFSVFQDSVFKYVQTYLLRGMT